MFFISFGCSYIDGPTSFRLAWGIQAIPAAILFPVLFFFPESPRWLASKDRWEEALETLAAIHGNGDKTNALVVAEYEEVRDVAMVNAEAKNLSWLGLFGKENNMWKRTMAGVFVRKFPLHFPYQLVFHRTSAKSHTSRALAANARR